MGEREFPNEGLTRPLQDFLSLSTRVVKTAIKANPKSWGRLGVGGGYGGRRWEGLLDSGQRRVHALECSGQHLLIA